MTTPDQAIPPSGVTGALSAHDAGSAAGRRDETREAIRANASLSVPFLVMNALAAVVASYGLLQNSAAVIIGAMIIAVLLGPITGIALALVDGDQPLLRRSLLAETVGMALVLTIGFSIGKIHAEMHLGSEISARTAPNIMDLIIALAGGSAGAYATVSPRLSAGLVGVAIATALVPPLCACGICIAHGLYADGGGAFLLFFTNLVAIQSATSFVFWASGYHRLSTLDRGSLLRRFAPSALLLTLLAVFLGHSFQVTIAQESLRARAKSLLRRRIGANGAANLTELDLQPRGSRTILIAVVRAPWIIKPESCARLQEEIRRETNQNNVDLQIRTVITRECNAQGYLWENDPDTPQQTTPPPAQTTTPAQTPTTPEQTPPEQTPAAQTTTPAQTPATQQDKPATTQ